MRCDMPNCIGGFIFDPYTKTKTPCPKCAERKEGELADGEVQRKLKLPEGMTNNKANNRHSSGQQTYLFHHVLLW